MTFEVSLPARGTTVELEFATEVPADPGVALVPVSTSDGLELPVTALAAQGLLESLEAVGARGKQGEVSRLLIDDHLTLSFGLGDSDEIDEDAVRRAAGALARNLTGVERATITTELGIRPIVEGLLLGGYSYTGLKAQPEEETAPTRITVVGSDSAESRAEFDRAVIIAESALLARDLVNTPGNFLYPETYARIMEEVAGQCGLDVEVYDEEYLAANGFGGIVAVGQGSARPPRLVHLVWDGTEGASSRAIALVGKGITFDTGGISLKPAPQMEDMISDMGGSAAQLASIAAAARLGVNARIEAWLPLAENMPSGSATRPGDVITHYGGLTSEVLNTDAEGRLVLADALARASEDAPDYLIEVATLTGAQMVALGTRTTAVMGSDEFRDRVAEIGREVGENAWAMPLLVEQEEELRSPIADMRNVHNSRNGGMLYAGLYLSRFIHDDTQWVHMDIAGPSWNTGSVHGYTPKRATGTPVRTIVEALSELAGK
ncbi:leucyl aminopeptidase [Corynebacterium sanguinis]|uniref:leucyl aminopeptidase n=1 Tax=Corynebacterium sanguinis TaxID=2594913 RepID=UPI0010AAA2AB|nr:leucyl aminopeptidase [Corynebacterium sanguinis]MCT1613104.1 leucyl aminopeptidase [Corynebacterium sanguinis]MCT1804470.1 leucyl aminopeptidase [Corynebacterium sanguinis]MCT2157709.1 leucyl aminopeptidase [Corynebacterium sanguinis]MCT2287119.1 leucyl aminopeptidase [Corynebacterium sanguinis]TVS25131.1 leucyl aminopeptidase [Corynebacterium sanguinis]